MKGTAYRYSKPTIFKIQSRSKLVQGTGLLGYVTSSYSKLVRAFGKPSVIGNEDKVQAEWILRAGSVYFTIYDYKETVSYKRVTDWHVGGHGDDSANIVFILKTRGFIMRENVRR